ncbi:MAG: hypothetical protein ACYTF1_25470 [Planctomycetota bacterium]
MSGIDEREILRRADEIAQIEPTPEATQRAVERVRKGLILTQNRKQQIMRKIILPTSIAAGIIIVMGVFVFSLSHKSVNAAELLKQVAQINGAYKGWVHMTTKREGKAGEASLSEVISETHINTVDGTAIHVIKRDGRTEKVHYEKPSGQEWLTYDVETNEIKVTIIRPRTADYMTDSAMNTPLNLEARLAKTKKWTGREPEGIEYTQEGEFDRFDIVFFSDFEEAKRVLSGLSHVAGVALAFTLWVDPQTKLIHKSEYESLTRYQDGVRREEGSSLTSYGEPIIEEIYDVGVPRNATVIDMRPKVDIEPQELVDRLEERIERGFGDCVCVRAEIPIEDGKLDVSYSHLFIFIQQGDAWLYNRYLVGEEFLDDEHGRRRRASPVIPLLEGWPVPDVQDALVRCFNHVPTNFFVTDGSDAWQGYHTGDLSFDGMGKLKDYMLRQMNTKSQFGLSGKIWPSKEKLHYYSREGVKIELLYEDDRPCQVGVYVDAIQVSMPTMRKEVKSRIEVIHWIDPSRDDIPIDSTILRYMPEGKTVSDEFHAQYLSHGQLPNGQWYPTKWRTSFVMYDKKGKLKYSNHNEHHLRIYPDVKVSDRWFTNPTERLGAARLVVIPRHDRRNHRRAEHALHLESVAPLGALL